MKCTVWSVGCKLWSVSVKRRVESGECGVWSVNFECGVWRGGSNQPAVQEMMADREPPLSKNTVFTGAMKRRHS